MLSFILSSERPGDVVDDGAGVNKLPNQNDFTLHGRKWIKLGYGIGRMIHISLTVPRYVSVKVCTVCLYVYCACITYVCMYVKVCVHFQNHVCAVCMYVLSIYICICVCMNVCMYVCMYVCVCKVISCSIPRQDITNLYPDVVNDRQFIQ